MKKVADNKLRIPDEEYKAKVTPHLIYVRKLIVEFFNFRATKDIGCECCEPKIQIKREVLDKRWRKYCAKFKGKKGAIPPNPDGFDHNITEVLKLDAIDRQARKALADKKAKDE